MSVSVLANSMAFFIIASGMVLWEPGREESILSNVFLIASTCASVNSKRVFQRAMRRSSSSIPLAPPEQSVSPKNRKQYHST